MLATTLSENPFTTATAPEFSEDTYTFSFAESYATPVGPLPALMLSTTSFVFPYSAETLFERKLATNK